jgi:hypothetical protein
MRLSEQAVEPIVYLKVSRASKYKLLLCLSPIYRRSNITCPLARSGAQLPPEADGNPL